MKALPKTFLGLLFLGAVPVRAQESLLPMSPLTAQDRILVLSPHPDDDILGCAGILHHAAAAKIPVRVVYLTNGDNYEWAFWLYKKHPVLSPEAMIKMGEMRRREATQAENLLGVSEDQLTFLGYPDWGTEKIFSSYWRRDGKPYRSMMTRVRQVPYPEALNPGAPYEGESVLGDLEQVMREFKPTRLFVSHPADGHRDHRALALFAQIALWDLQNEIHPEVYPYLVHYPHWPKPRGYHPERPAETPKDLRGIAWVRHSLSPEDVTLKWEALKRHRTQMGIDRTYLESFARTTELFGGFLPIPLHGRTPVDIPVSTHTFLSASLEEVEEVQWKHVFLEPEDLVLRLELKSGVHLPGAVTVYAFGYRSDKPFAEMPKLRFVLRRKSVDVFDQHVALKDSGVEIRREGRTVFLRVPRRLLGDPTRVIASAWSRAAEEPFDWRIWRIVELGPSL